MHCEETANYQLSRQKAVCGVTPGFVQLARMIFLHKRSSDTYNVSRGRLVVLPTATAGFSAIKFPSRGIVANFIPLPSVFPLVSCGIPAENFACSLAKCQLWRHLSKLLTQRATSESSMTVTSKCLLMLTPSAVLPTFSSDRLDLALSIDAAKH